MNWILLVKSVHLGHSEDCKGTGPIYFAWRAKPPSIIAHVSQMALKLIFFM